MSKAARALIADDHSLYRNGLALLLKDQLEFDEVLEAATFAEAVALISEFPDLEIALFDLAMPGMQGPASLQPMRQQFPAIKLAIVAASEAKEDVLAAIAAGLNGFISKTLPSSEMIAAIEYVRAGGIYVPGFMASLGAQLPAADSSRTVVRTSSAGRGERPQALLTQRQQEVLDCVRAGMSNKEIAEKFQISVGTVKVHVGALLTAMNAKNRIQLTIQSN